MEIKPRTIVFVGFIAAFYTVLTITLSPISYGPIQFRVSEILKPLSLFNPFVSVSFGIGTFISNLFSPFGIWDYLFMPIVDVFAALICYYFRRAPIFAIFMQSIIISIGVCIFPLWLGGNLPFLSTFIPILFSQVILLYVGYFVIWKKYGPYLLRSWK